MSERLRASDLALLAEETPQTPMHNATLEIFDPADSGFDYDALLAHIDDRIAFVPRYRQHVRRIPGRLANPVWVDDEHFDLAYHVRRSALPRPGTVDQLRDLTARIMSRRLDPDRPLWEIYFVEGLEDGRVALLSKSHQILVDGISTVDLGQVLLDVDPGPRQLVRDDWVAPAEPTPARLAARAMVESARHPKVAVSTLRSNAEALGRTVGGAACQGRRDRRRAGQPPLHAGVAVQRRALRPAAGGAGAHLAQGLPQDPPGARRHRQRRHPGHPVGRDPRLVHDPRRVGGRRAAAAGAGADERDRRGARADLARVAGGRPPRRPADRRGVARRTPAPGVLRPARAQRDRPRRGRRPDRRASPASRRPPSTRSGPGWRSRRPAAASTW